MVDLRRFGPALAALLPTCLAVSSTFSCRGATQVKVKVWTDLPCEQVRGRGTALTAGSPEEDLETKPPARVSLDCDPNTGALGELVIVPTGDEREAEFAFKIVTAVTAASVDNCQAPAYDGCIVARRVLRYVSNTTLYLDVLMRASCEGIECNSRTTCFDRNECRSAIIEDPSQCETPGACNSDSLPPGDVAGAGGASGSAGASGAGGGTTGGGGGTGGNDTGGSAGEGGSAGGAGGTSGGGAGGSGGAGGALPFVASAFATGYNHACALVSGPGTPEQVRCWGQQGRPQGADWALLGRNFGIAPQTLNDAELPETVGLLRTGWQSACVGTPSGSGFGVLCFGGNANHVLGNTSPGGNGPPTPIADGGVWGEVSSGRAHACGTKAGDVYCWGSNLQKQRGILLAGLTPEQTPSKITSGGGFTTVDAGENHTCGLKAGALFCWGDNTQRQLGHNDALLGLELALTDVAVPPGNPGGLWAQLSAGTSHTCAVLNDASLWCWGKNDRGQANPKTPGGVVNFPGRLDQGSWSQVASGQAHTCALDGGGRILCWGDDSRGQLGDGGPPPPTPPTTPVAIVDPDPGVPWASIDAGAFHTCARKTNGSLYCWGQNDLGQCGLGAGPSDVSVPALVPFGP